MLKLYLITFYFLNDPGSDLYIYVMAYNQCHAVNLLYREYEALGKLNDIRHARVVELHCINPSKFKKNG